MTRTGGVVSKGDVEHLARTSNPMRGRLALFSVPERVTLGEAGLKYVRRGLIDCTQVRERRTQVACMNPVLLATVLHRMSVFLIIQGVNGQAHL